MSTQSILVRAVKKVYPRFGVRNNDVFLASYPKSGNTWVRFIWANIVSLEEKNGDKISFHKLDGKLGSEYDRHNYGSVEFECLPRLVKTHKIYSNDRFGKNKSIYVIRHPGDVLISYYEYLRSRKGSNVSSDCGFSAFIRSDRYGMPAWADHVRSWLPNADVVVRYEDLKVDSATVVGSALSRLGVGETIENSVIQEAARRSAFDQMKKIEEKHGRPLQDEFDKNFRFVRKGTSGGWKREFKDDDRKYVEEFVESRFGHKYEKIEPNIQ